MADNTKIEWADATVNVVNGCSVVSPGCTNCYAMRLAGTRMKNHPSRTGLTVPSKAGPVWNGQVRFIESELLKPLRWRRPRKIFVCAHGDLFHEAVPDEWIDRVFAMMALCPHHTFQVLTKRAERMRDYCTGMMTPTRLVQAAMDLPEGEVFSATWPLPNVWLGISAEDQQRYDERRKHLESMPAAVRFISAEPLLSGINLKLTDECYCDFESREFFGSTNRRHVSPCPMATQIDWVIAGGESGTGARPCHPDWARSLRDQCAAAGVAFFWKQWGEFAPFDAPTTPYAKVIHEVQVDGVERCTSFSYPEGALMSRVGKKAAGALLDGREHREFPQ